MNIWLVLAFLFFIGSVIGWVAELLFRRFISSANPERKWINPGFCVGPYIPLYGFGLCFLFLIASLEPETGLNPFWSKTLLVLAMAVCMTLIEYIAGILSLKVFKVRLWDYRKEWGNIQGLICPKFSLIWALLGAAYYFLIHPYILNALAWLSRNLAFSFFIGLFFGVFLLDVAYSTHLVNRIRAFAKSNEVIVRYEHLKAYVRSAQEKRKQRPRFLFPLRSDVPLSEHLKNLRDSLEKNERKKKKEKK